MTAEAADLLRPIDSDADGIPTDDLVQHCLLRLRELERREATENPAEKDLEGLNARNDFAHARVRAVRNRQAKNQAESDRRSREHKFMCGELPAKAKAEMEVSVSYTDD